MSLMARLIEVAPDEFRFMNWTTSLSREDEVPRFYFSCSGPSCNLRRSATTQFSSLIVRWLRFRFPDRVAAADDLASLSIILPSKRKQQHTRGTRGRCLGLVLWTDQ